MGNVRERASKASAESSGPKGPSSRRGQKAVVGAALAALGVVFGDIGTSPLYALQTVFPLDGGAVKPTAGDVSA